MMVGYTNLTIVSAIAATFLIEQGCLHPEVSGQ